MKKRARKIAIVLALVAAVSGIWAFYFRDSFITDAVNRYGSAILGVSVKLKRAHLDVTGQSIELHGLAIGNPVGYKSRHLLELDKVMVRLDVSSLAREVVLIREIVILKPNITFEKIAGVSNFDVVQRNVDNFTGTVPGKKSTQPEKRWIIEDVVVRDGHAVVLSDLVLTDSLSVSIPNVHLRDIGKRTNGATTADATKQVMSAFTSSVTHAAGAAISSTARGVSQGVGKGVKKLGTALKGLFHR